MDQLQARLGSLLNRPLMEDAATKELAEAARARVDVLRSLLRTPAVVGDDEYERLLKEVFDATTKLLGRAPTAHRGPESEEGWKLAGFQATAPDREFRGGGLLGLHCLLHALEHHPATCAKLLEGPFPFAAASINMTLVAARLAGVASADDALKASIGDKSPQNAPRDCRSLLATSHAGFFEVHALCLDALERARSDVDAGAMDFMGCAVAAREEVSLLLSHAPRDVEALKKLARAVPRRRSGFLTMHASSNFLMKREPVRRFFVLSTSRLKWYEERDVHSSTRSAATLLAPGKPAGSLVLQGDATVRFRVEERSFSIVSSKGKQLLWLVADEARDMEKWCVALTEHCALAAIDLSQRLEAGTVVSSETFEAVPYVVDAAVGIYVREAPDVAAPRTGRGLMPGEEVEIVERVVVDDAKGGRTFLRLADGGWAMERHPSSGVPILRVSSGDSV
ncbi:unnamed protein product [Pelagomonas calceolata]|uniref:PH domain-containing protein n=1 Tax=Pelagomonas calceolata TaxID=35677 RepID=A0A6S8U5K1_9STRA|nr:unnamed protein product [Pelagomonas calceolata]|mmetsp:Transcript_7600/g.18791  ORF Transcript_7600/g.18791 Transcript_7600/m.18791 type:complete len:452 (-) Transcript_7600:47-1402(-)